VEVLPLRPLLYGIPNSTSNGVRLTVRDAEPIQSITQTSGANPLTVTGSVTSVAAIPDQHYQLRVAAAFTDSSGAHTYLTVELKNSADSLIRRVDSLLSGQSIQGQGFSLMLTFSSAAMPATGTTVTIVTASRKPLTYLDAFTFTTTGARVDARAVASELDRVKVVPNPYLISSLYEFEYGAQRREPIRVLKFNNLPSRCTIHIFTLDGDKVQTIEHNSDNGTENWNMRGAGGREIAPGVYLYLVKTDTAEKIGRFAVIK
jgi:hypothetical protein